MKFELTIDCDNAAFEPEVEGAAAFEVARILESAVGILREPGLPDAVHLALRDTNGNTVGFAKFTHDDEVDDREFLQPDYDEELS